VAVSDNITRTRTRDKVLTKERLARALELVELTPEEEIVVRLRYGIGLAPHGKLRFRGGSNEELKIRLAMIEKSMLEYLEAEAKKSTEPGKLEPFGDL